MVYFLNIGIVSFPSHWNNSEFGSFSHSHRHGEFSLSHCINVFIVAYEMLVLI